MDERRAQDGDDRSDGPSFSGAPRALRPGRAPYQAPPVKSLEQERSAVVLIFGQQRLLGDALQWLRREGRALGLDTDRIAVGGDSAGGTQAAVCSLLARDTGMRLALQLLFYPGTAGRHDPATSASVRDFGQGFILDTALIEYFFRQYIDDAERNLDWFTSSVNGNHANFTPGGEAVVDVWGTSRYAANAAFLALEFSNWLTAQGKDADKAKAYHDFGVRQINYMLGDNPNKISYEVGFTNGGKNTAWPRNPHSRGAHGSWSNNISDPPNNRHQAIGELVGGPNSASSDAFTDDRSNYQQNEGALDYNSLFSGALAELTSERESGANDGCRTVRRFRKRRREQRGEHHSDTGRCERQDERREPITPPVMQHKPRRRDRGN